MRRERAAVQAVRERADIVSVISRYLSLAKAGTEYKGRCPFHKDDTPSLMVSPEKGLWHCFGCGEGGDIFAFLMKIERIAFPEALERLASEVGISLERRDDGKQDKLRVLNATVADYFAVNLTDRAAGRKAREYLIGRGYEEETWEQFGLGYALPGWEHLKKRFSKTYSEQTLLDLGLLVRGEKGSYDRFRDRVIFPIYDLTSRPIAFGGRTFSGEPKYLNSPKSTLFDKGRHLYGLSWAREALQAQRTAILVEGYTDVLSLHRAGVTRAVGSMGTALTQEQAALLGRFVEEVVIVYDRDTAGGAASLRGMQVLRNSGLSVRVAALPQGDDPDGFVRRNGAEQFLDVVHKAIPFHLFFIESLKGRYDLTTLAGKEGALTETRPFYQGIASLPLKQEIASKLSELLDLPTEGVLADLAGKRSMRRPVKEPQEKGSEGGAQEVILSLLLSGQVAWEQVATVAAPADFSSAYRPLVESLAMESGPLDLSLLMQRLDEESARQVSRLALLPHRFSSVDKALQDALSKLVQLPAIEKRLAVLREEMKRSEEKGDRTEFDRLQRAYSVLVGERLSRRRDGEGQRRGEDST
ncbi:DNA primase [Candidatus Bipolaricaulota bacterium]|nr:DNA primase [Candidatus Bipolaricaulota bacterium]